MTFTRAYRSLLRRWGRLWGQDPLVEIAIDLWDELLAELGRRGLDGKRESGAFLLGNRRRNKRKVSRVAYFDDLDPECLVGNIHLRAPAYSALWDFCELTGLVVVGDVHTHPGAGVAQSSIDQSNPMVASTGHIALIVPHYGTRIVGPREIGVHEYLGDAGWNSRVGPAAEITLRIRGK